MKASVKFRPFLPLACLASFVLTASFAHAQHDVTSPVTITGADPEIVFDNTSSGQTSWEIEVGGRSGLNFEVSVNGSTNGSGPFKIHTNANADQLTLGDNGGVVINGELAQDGNELEVLASTSGFAAIAVSPDGTSDDSARFQVSSTSDLFSIGVRTGSGGYNSAIRGHLDAPNSSIEIDAQGDVGVGGVNNVQYDFHVGGGQLFLDPSGTSGDWRLSPGSTGLFFRNEDLSPTSPVQFWNGAPDASFVVDSDGSVGVGTSMPERSVEVLRDDGTAGILVNESNASTTRRTLMELRNNGAPQCKYTNTDSGISWELNPNLNDKFVINSLGLGGGTEFTLNPTNGNCDITGQLRASAFIVVSSKHAKTGFEKIDVKKVLDSVVNMPITRWQYQDDDKTDHIGPMSQDFHAAFGLGAEDTTISVVDMQGVSMAAIQGLHQVIQEKDAEIESLDAEVESLTERLERLETIVETMAANMPE